MEHPPTIWRKIGISNSFINDEASKRSTVINGGYSEWLASGRRYESEKEVSKRDLKHNAIGR